MGGVMNFQNILVHTEEKFLRAGLVLRIEIFARTEQKDRKHSSNEFGFSGGTKHHYCRVYEGAQGSWTEKYFIPEINDKLPRLDIGYKNDYDGPGMDFAHLDEYAIAKKVWEYFGIKD